MSNIGSSIGSNAVVEKWDTLENIKRLRRITSELAAMQASARAAGRENTAGHLWEAGDWAGMVLRNLEDAIDHGEEAPPCRT